MKCKGEKGLRDIGRCNCWPINFKVFKTKFLSLSKMSFQNFGESLDKFHQFVQESFGFSIST